MVAIEIRTNWYNGKIIIIRRNNRINVFSTISFVLIKLIIGSDNIKVKDPLIPNIMNISIRWLRDLALKYLINLINIINN
jgi:hypothetical protein